ncbi:MarR family winged helix-turn-helix transcriptional regulator [Paenibacillus montanisoli]|uniref:MarR family winged helix-turn-helix transcriptional regulator n=1 Tax=Paenibacillus montanisoli TaxID=2081970 RepID=UPI00197F54E3|nr:MarR family transcriptional regulator [Paenibacillus montanisoli]
MSIQERPPFQSAGFAIGLAYRKLSALLQQRLGEYDITTEQWSVLNQVYRTPGMIQKDIADRVGKDKPTTTRILDLLERKGLVLKQAGQQDRRSFLVFCTEQGASAMRETAPIEESVTADVRACMSDEEYALFMNLLMRVHLHASERLTAGESHRRS